METDIKIAVSLPPVSPSAPTNVSNNAFPPVRPMHGRTSGPTRRSTRGQWTPEEDEVLRRAVQRYQGKNWKKIAECFKDRTDVQCLHRWQKVLNPELIKGPWSKEEDETIVQLVNKYGPKKWSTIAQHLPGRIGKQCRERWHNHLNPAINREPWTQDEEIVLIRAHQIHGNKWAELTKYLSGRTDNAIKNHWNSSVKKKLDSFLDSGLLAQFQGLPLISHQNESNPGASLRVRCSNGDGSVSTGGADAEENSESTLVGVSQTVGEISNTEDSNYGKVQVTREIGSYSGQYYMSLDDVAFTIPNIPCEFSYSPKYLDTNLKDSETCVNGNCNFDLTALQNMALELAMNSTDLSGIYELAETQNDGAHGLSHLSTGYNASTLVNNMALESEFCAHDLEPSVEGCSQVTLPQEGCVQYPSSVNLTNSADIIDMDRYSDPQLGFQSSFQVSEVGGTVTLQPFNPLNGAMGEASQCRNLPSALDPMNDNLTTSQAHEVAKVVLANAQDHSALPSNAHIDVSLSEPVDTFGSETLDSQQTLTPTAREEERTGKEEAGTLCYEPPRFPPTLNIPFFSCDLAQSCTDGQQDFSPLGIRQLMMSSMNCLTPFKLWDSPSSDDTPDAVLKSSSKTCLCTPSILKKRRRDLLSPLSPFSERRYGRKIRSDINQGFLCTSKLTKEFSRLDVIVNDAHAGKELPSTSDDQNDTAEVSIEEMEDICSASLTEAKEKNCNNIEDEPSEVDAENNNEREDTCDHHSTLKAYEYEHCGSEMPRGILVECHSNSTNFSSPSEARPKAVSKSSEGTTEVHQNSIHTVGPNKDVAPSSQSASAVSSLMVDSLLNEVGAENLNIFGGTPFRRSIESPSAWKSPWYFSSLVPFSRFDTDVMLEDIGIFMSPGEKSVDALSLMKQINEQNADAYADAKKVLGSDTPDSILRQRCFRNQDTERRTEKGTDGQSEGRLRLASNISTECRTLDFSECGTPAKSVQKGKCRSNATSSSSPSCLLKNYR